MGSPTAPNFQAPTIGGIAGSTGHLPGGLGGSYQIPGQPGLPGGNDLEAYAKNLLQNGLPADLQADYLKQGQGQIAGNLRSGEQNLNQLYASQGNVPIGAQIAGETGLRNDANKAGNELNSNLTRMNFDAKQTGFGDYTSLINQALGLSGQANQYGMQKYQIDSENSFSWGNLVGGLLGLGGQLGGSFIKKGR